MGGERRGRLGVCLVSLGFILVFRLWSRQARRSFENTSKIMTRAPACNFPSKLPICLMLAVSILRSWIHLGKMCMGPWSNFAYKTTCNLGNMPCSAQCRSRTLPLICCRRVSSIQLFQLYYNFYFAIESMQLKKPKKVKRP